MEEKTKRIISIILGVTASIISFYYLSLILNTLIKAAFAVFFAAMGLNLTDIIMTVIFGIFCLIVGIFIFYNSITLTESNYLKKSRRLVIAGLLFLTYTLIIFIYIYFKSGWSAAFPNLGISMTGILSIAAGFLGISTDNEYSNLDEKKKFSKKLKLLSFIMLFLVFITIIFNFNQINKMGHQGNIEDLELDGKIVFQDTSPGDAIYNLCMVDLSNPEEINCFEENGRDPYWDSEGENIFYYTWDEERKTNTIVYNPTNNTKKILEGREAYEENKKLRKLARNETKNPYNSYLEAFISPDGKKKLYTFVGTVYLSDNSGKENILIKSGYPSTNDYCRTAFWYSNDKILILGKLRNDKIITDERYRSGFFIMDTKTSNLNLVVSNPHSDGLYYTYPDFYR